VWGFGGGGAGRGGAVGRVVKGRTTPHTPGRVRVGLGLRVFGVWRRELAMRVWAVGLGLGWGSDEEVACEHVHEVTLEARSTALAQQRPVVDGAPEMHRVSIGLQHARVHRGVCVASEDVVAASERRVLCTVQEPGGARCGVYRGAW
jgi:hypothetical protein